MQFRDVLAMAVQQGGGAAAPSLGPEILTNGSFTTNSDWVIDEGDAPMTISGGKLRAPSSDQSSTAVQLSSLTAGTYRVVFTIDSITDGFVFVKIDNDTAGAERAAAGTYTEDMIYTGGVQIVIQSVPFAVGEAVIDNVSVKRVL